MLIGKKPSGLPLALFLFATPLPAADIIEGFVDMRLGFGVGGGDYTVENIDADTEMDGEFESSYRTTLSWIGCLGLQRAGGVVWGLGFSYDANDDDEFAAYQSWALDGYLGYAFAFTEAFQIELAPFIGVGRAYMDISGDNVGQNDDSFTEGGANLNVLYTFTSGFQLGATLTYLITDSDINYDAVRYNFGSSDFVASLSIGARL